MDLDKYCHHCRHSDFESKNGVLCLLTKSQPNFTDVCLKFELDTTKKNRSPAEVFQKDSENKEKLPDLNVTLRNWGIALIILGIVHLFLISFLDPVWGFVIILLGVVNLLVKKRAMFIANGIALVLVGLMNILSSLLLDGGGSTWVGIGLLQLFWGVQEIRKYKKYKNDSVSESKSLTTKALTSDQSSSGIQIVKQKHSGFGMSSFIICCTVFVLQTLLLVFSVVKSLTDPEWFNYETPGTAIFGLCSMLAILLIFVGLGLGIAGLIEKRRKKVFAVLGVVFNSVLLLFSAFLFIPT
jgi:hypothetical protein